MKRPIPREPADPPGLQIPVRSRNWLCFPAKNRSRRTLLSMRQWFKRQRYWLCFGAFLAPARHGLRPFLPMRDEPGCDVPIKVALAVAYLAIPQSLRIRDNLIESTLSFKHHAGRGGCTAQRPPHSWFRRAARSLSADCQRPAAVSLHPDSTTGSADSVTEGDQVAAVAVDDMVSERVTDGSQRFLAWRHMIRSVDQDQSTRL